MGSCKACGNKNSNHEIGSNACMCQQSPLRHCQTNRTVVLCYGNSSNGTATSR